MTLPAHRKLINATWNESHLWLLTRSMTPTDVAETYELHEYAVMDTLNGTVIIKEVN